MLSEKMGVGWGGKSVGTGKEKSPAAPLLSVCKAEPSPCFPSLPCSLSGLLQHPAKGEG
jgi:hypothetical protein